MLFGGDVLDMERQKRRIVLVRLAIFAATACAFTNEGSECGVHHSSERAVRSWRALDLRMPTKVPKFTYVLYSASSSGASNPLLCLSARSSTRACRVASACSANTCLADSGVKHSPSGVTRRSSTEGRCLWDSCFNYSILDRPVTPAS